MDLELIGKQMLEALAVQGQIAPLVTKLQQLESELDNANANIEKAKETKASNVSYRKSAESKLSKAIQAVQIAEQGVVDAKVKVSEAKTEVDRTKMQLDKYNDAFLSQLDENIKHSEEARQPVEINIAKVLKELDSVKADLTSRQAILAEQGIELNIGKLQAKTTYL